MAKPIRVHTVSERVHYVCYVDEGHRLSGPFRSRRLAQAAVERALAAREYREVASGE